MGRMEDVNSYQNIMERVVKNHWLTDETIMSVVAMEIALKVGTGIDPSMVWSDMKRYASDEGIHVRFLA